MVPRCLSQFEEFYGSRKNLLKRKSGRIIRFIEHEPFEFRLLGMPFSPEEGERLDTAIRFFLNSHFSSEECMASGLHFPFQLFLKFSGFSDFKTKLRYMEQRTGIIRKISTLCPVPSWRRKARIQTKEVLEMIDSIQMGTSVHSLASRSSLKSPDSKFTVPYSILKRYQPIAMKKNNRSFGAREKMACCASRYAACSF